MEPKPLGRWVKQDQDAIGMFLAWAGGHSQALTGASFIVNGATPPKNSALASAGAKLHITKSWSLAAKSDGEFASGSRVNRPIGFALDGLGIALVAADFYRLLTS
jgi:hypothetical protein